MIDVRRLEGLDYPQVEAANLARQLSAASALHAAGVSPEPHLSCAEDTLRRLCRMLGYTLTEDVPVRAMAAE